MSPHAARIQLCFHMRRPAGADAPSSEALFQESLRMMDWADGKVTAISLSEHHVSGDGFMTSPLLMAGAAVAKTRRSQVAILALLLPLHDVVEVAEQLAYLDLMSGGRVLTVLGLGYRPEEYAVFGRDWAARGADFDAQITTLLALLRGEEVDVNGVAVRLDHLPLSPVEEIVIMGGNSLIAARRAARNRLWLVPAGRSDEVEETYHAACREIGFEGFYEYPPVDGYTLLARDPDAAWSRVGANLLFDAQSYHAMSHPTRRSGVLSDANSIEDLRREGTYAILTPDQFVDAIASGRSMVVNPLAGGIDPELGWESLELYEAEVLPRLTIAPRLFTPTSES